MHRLCVQMNVAERLSPSISHSCLCDASALALDASNVVCSVEFFRTIATMLRADIATDNVHTTGSRAQYKTIALTKSATESCSATETCSNAPRVGMVIHWGISISAGMTEPESKYGSKARRQGNRTKVPTLTSSFSRGKEAGTISSRRNVTTANTGYCIVPR